MLGAPGPRHTRGPLLVVSALLPAAVLAAAAWLLLRRPAQEPRLTSAPTTRRAPAAVTASPAAPAAAAGTLQVDAGEPGALVAVDGEPLGPAPQTRQLAPGPHLVRVTKEGREPWERELQLIPGHTARVTARLDTEPARLRVDADVPGASVFLDRKFLGTTPLETRGLGPGSHRLNVSAEGYEMYAETLELGAGPNEVVVRFKEVRLDETLAVAHRHGMGSCRGTLRATTAGLRYDANDARDTFETPFGSLEPLQVDYLKKNLRVRLRAGKTYNFTADSAERLLAFQKAVEAARKRL